MIILLSPAKTLDFSASEVTEHSTPRLLADSEKLINVLKKKSKNDIKKLMSVSDNIAELNVERYQNFETPFSLDNAKQAALAFKGDVYTGLEANTFNAKERSFAQAHIRILSGLYGVLRPNDLMQAYRLEMGTKLKIRRKNNLYEFWDDRITKLLNEDLQESGSDIILNLASNEYFKSVKNKALKGDLYKVDFKEWRGDKYKVISFNAKKARGVMAKLIVQKGITKVEELKGLDVNGYVFNEDLSTEKDFCFTK